MSVGQPQRLALQRLFGQGTSAPATPRGPAATTADTKPAAATLAPAQVPPAGWDRTKLLSELRQGLRQSLATGGCGVGPPAARSERPPLPPGEARSAPPLQEVEAHSAPPLQKVEVEEETKTEPNDDEDDLCSPGAATLADREAASAERRQLLEEWESMLGAVRSAAAAED